jgi:hypothetical protein
MEDLSVNDLVERLSKEQPIKPEGEETTLKELQERIELGYIDILFTETDTDLGMDLYEPECSIPKDILKSGKGNIKTVGYFTLNYDKVMCTANINLQTLEGTGYLTPVHNEKYEEVMEEYKKKDPYL